MPYNSFFARIQCLLVKKFINQLVFITENEYEYFCNLTKSKLIKKNIIFNSVSADKPNRNKYSEIKKKKFLIGCISNYSYYRGTDRVIKLASMLPKKILKHTSFVIVGTNKIPNGTSKRIHSLKGIKTLEDYAKKLNVNKYFTFLGHISDTHNVIIHLDLMLRLSRENNPWGRDVLESLSFAVPVVSTGSYNGFIKNSVNGILISDYKISKLKDEIIKLIADKKKLKKMSSNCKKVILKKCDPEKNAKKLYSIFKKNFNKV